ncbi:amino acid ABC transporter permease [Caproicibacterium sp. BJN0003]|uniref:amino acid ABC transporter permease n=1 Tax=Caproicibacterium sp. BJN0003 TaxID=2994078 RepID=UPI002254BAAA|nr:amino acid ABC transporter permease [Caproicibacterium sp. BJN0003]UZT81221.1 amino acid ABC transporter permease [Caproicibacterium sp. BJN0003]
MEILSQVFSKNNMIFMFQGIGMMLSVAVVAILLSLLFGTILGAVKSYGPKPLRVIVSVYIEIFRTTPNLLWILIIYFLVPFGKGIPSMVKDFMSGSLAFTLFTSAVVAEIVRGGLNSIPKGQFEAAASQGFSLFQTLKMIVLPQALRVSIPALLSQVITVVKDTSLLAAVNIAEFTVNGRIVIAQFSGNAAAMFLVYGFMALIYFAICFTLSICVRRLQHPKVVSESKNSGKMLPSAQ